MTSLIPPRRWASPEARRWMIHATRTRSVLVVDDDNSLSRLLTIVFRDAGYDVATAPDGQAALACVAAETPDVVILDLEMPGMNGREFYRELRTRGVSCPVLILSAYGAKAGQQELGAQSYMNKPFDPDDLLSAVGTLLH